MLRSRRDRGQLRRWFRACSPSVRSGASRQEPPVSAVPPRARSPLTLWLPGPNLVVLWATVLGVFQRGGPQRLTPAHRRELRDPRRGVLGRPAGGRRETAPARFCVRGPTSIYVRHKAPYIGVWGVAPFGGEVFAPGGTARPRGGYSETRAYSEATWCALFAHGGRLSPRALGVPSGSPCRP